MEHKGDGGDATLREGQACQAGEAAAGEVQEAGDRGVAGVVGAGRDGNIQGAQAGAQPSGQGGVVISAAGGQAQGAAGNGVIPAVVVPPPMIQDVAGKKMAAVYLEPSAEDRKAGKTGVVMEFSPQEALVLKTFLDCGDYQATAAAVGIKRDSVRRILGRPNLKRFLRTVMEQAAIDTATTPKWVITSMRKVADGQTIPEQSWDAVKQIGKRLWPEKEPGSPPPGQVNIQNNFYTGLGKEKINAEWVARGVRR